jgi:hypothetical protein
VQAIACGLEGLHVQVAHLVAKQVEQERLQQLQQQGGVGGNGGRRKKKART